MSAIEVRKVYDTTKPGRANTGHTFGDKLTDDGTASLVIEYLKTPLSEEGERLTRLWVPRSLYSTRVRRTELSTTRGTLSQSRFQV